MREDPRHTLAGTLAPIGACIVVVSVAMATDPEFRPVIRVLWLTPAIGTILATAVYLWRALRSRGRRGTRQSRSERTA